MTDNTAKDSKGQSIDVYENDIYCYADEYINGLDDNQDMASGMIRKTPVFKGMLKTIYINIFKITDKDIKYNNKNSRIDYSDIELLNNIWDIYTGLCYKYCQNPTLLNFSIMTGIDMTTFDDWRKGEMRASGDMLGSSHSQSVKKWLKECESAAYDVAMSGNPGGMFILKANYGYTEAPQQIQFIGQDQSKSIEQIAAEHAPELCQNTDQLELPDGDF